MKRLACLLGVVGVGALAVLSGCEEGAELVDGVDLKVVELRIPSATGIEQGSAVTLTVLVKNNGTERISREFATRIDFYENAALSVRSVWDAVELSCPADVTYPEGFTGTLASGATIALEAQTTADARDPPRLVFCRATCDSGGAIDEVNEGNNSYLKACQVNPGVAPPDTADLMVGALGVPEEIELGSELVVSVTVRNSGDAEAVAPFAVTVEVFKDAEHTDMMWPAETATQNEGLAPDAEVTLDFSFDTQLTDPLTPLYVLATVDSAGEVEEKYETNNTSTAETELVPLLQPDLLISLLEVPDVVERGSTLPVTLTVRNGGGVTAPGPFTVKVTVYEDPSYQQVLWSPWEEEQAADLDSGGEVTFDLSFTSRAVDPLGTVYLVAKVDTQDVVAEGNEENNTATWEFDVILPSDPDLIISAISAPDSVVHGETVYIQVTIKNVGGGPALAPFYVSLNVYKDSELKNSIRPEAEWEVSTNFLSTDPERSHGFPFTSQESDGTGSIYFEAIVDSGSHVDEAVDDNNTATATSEIKTQPKPNLVCTINSITDPYDTSAGSFSLGYTVTNVGVVWCGGSFLYVWIESLDGTWSNDLASFDVPPLDPGMASSATRSVPLASVPVSLAHYYVVIMADGSGNIAEEAEGDNTASYKLLVRHEP